MHTPRQMSDDKRKEQGRGDCVAASYLVMHLFSQERLKSRGITAAVYGNFFAPKQQELVLGGPRAAAKCSRAHKAR